MKLTTIFITITFYFLHSFTLCAQELKDVEPQEATKKRQIRFQGDSRQTIINNESVGIFGVRLGVLFDEKKEIGLGVYSSNLFGILGSSVTKEYRDNDVEPSITLPANIGFHYVSAYGEYVLVQNSRLIFTANSQVGLGWVAITFNELAQRDVKREGKGIIEHSVKLDIKVLKWLRLMGGLGYRYLVAGETQIKETFNAPIYITGFSIDFKQLFKKKSKDKP